MSQPDQAVEGASSAAQNRMLGGEPSYQGTNLQLASVGPTQIKLGLRRPASMMSDGNTQEETVIIEANATVLNIKHRIATTWKGRPRQDGLRLIAQGRILGDAELLGEALNAKPGDTFLHPVHVVINSDAWTQAQPLPDQSPPPALIPVRTSASGVDARQPSPTDETNLPSPSFRLNPFVDLSNSGIGQSPAVPALIGYFVRLSRSQRLRFVEQLLHAQLLVQERSIALREQIRLARVGNHLVASENTVRRSWEALEAEWGPIESSIISMLRGADFWLADAGDAGPDKLPPTACEFERVEFNGFPFLLYLPSSLRNDDSVTLAALNRAYHRILTIDEALQRLSIMVGRMSTLLPDIPDRFSRATGVAVFAGNTAFPAPTSNIAPAPILPDSQVRAFQMVVNLDNIFRYAGPLLWLALKLSLLLYLFARNASRQKRWILIGFACVWVIWEGWAIRQRRRRREREGRAREGRRADPVADMLARERRRAERRNRMLAVIQDAQGMPAPPPAPESVTARTPASQPDPIVQPHNLSRSDSGPAPTTGSLGSTPDRQVEGIEAIASRLRARGGTFPPRTEFRRMRPTSRLSPRFWITAVAVVGLAGEYRELGLHPRTSPNESGMANEAPRVPMWKRVLQTCWVCSVLFLGTLLPEVERIRKKALERRARLLEAVVTHADRVDRQAAREATAGASSRVNQVSKSAVGPSTSNTSDGPRPQVTGESGASDVADSERGNVGDDSAASETEAEVGPAPVVAADTDDEDPAEQEPGMLLF